MKKTSLQLAMLCFLSVYSAKSMAQNVFPATGNVGIGTTAPAEALHVMGSTRMETNNDPVLIFNNTDNSWQYIEFKRSDIRQGWFGLNDGADLFLTKETQGNIALHPVNGNILLGPYGGNVGINTQTPTGHLSFGTQGNNLTIGNISYANQVILATGWNQTNGDFTDIRVPGALSNSALLRVQSNGNVGIGVSEAHEKFQVGTRLLFHDGGYKKISYNGYYDLNGGVLKRVEDAPVAEMAFTPDGSIQFGTAPTGTANSIVDVYNNVLLITNTGNVGIGTTNPGSYKLAVEGSIAARAIKVTSQNPFPDYVFDSTYRLRPLTKLEQYINQNKHLPGIPSAKEVEKDGGVELGAMNVKLLEKVEELTLYMIELKKENEEMKKEIKELKEKK